MKRDGRHFDVILIYPIAIGSGNTLEVTETGKVFKAEAGQKRNVIIVGRQYRDFDKTKELYRHIKDYSGDKNRLKIGDPANHLNGVIKNLEK